MSSINPISSAYSQQTSTSSSQDSSSSLASTVSDLGENEFLKLLVAQLQNQDPMEPTKNEEFVAQLATFSSLEQLISINKGVSELAALTSTTTNTNDSNSNQSTNS
jgi:flagellar basal-body rod modification protein FlgD